VKDVEIHEAMAILTEVVRQWRTPAVTIVSQREGDPFKVLVSCILSLRTQDRTTAAASERLFALAGTPAEMAALPVEVVEKAIYPVGFYRTKAVRIGEICRTLLEQYGGQVPDELDELLTLPGVGRKTANLVVTLGFGKPGICVDTHVHRISNRWGYVRTRNPEETEFALRAKLPHRYWLVINDLLVTFGQNHCTPLSPRCSTCPLGHLCDRVGVVKSR
jgi:endonuclease-3